METAFQRIGREQRERQEARAKRETERNKPRRKSIGPRGRVYPPKAERDAADRIDGYDRDDLGLSPDF